jgi:hypothetical protein
MKAVRVVIDRQNECARRRLAFGWLPVDAGNVKWRARQGRMADESSLVVSSVKIANRHIRSLYSLKVHHLNCLIRIYKENFLQLKLNFGV